MTAEDGSPGLLDGFSDALAGVTVDDVERQATPPVKASTAATRPPAGRVDVSSTAARDLADRLVRRAVPTSGDRWELIGAAPARTVEVAGSVVIGRGPHDDPAPRLVSSCAHVSRRHCLVSTRHDGSAEVAELGSANGTFVRRGDASITVGDDPVELCDGDALATADGLLTIAFVRRAGGAS